jgi:hypothetical protein
MLHLAPSRDVDNGAPGEDVLNSRTCREEPSTQSETQSEVHTGPCRHLEVPEEDSLT